VAFLFGDIIHGMYWQKSGNKYHAKSTQYQGIAYHSKLEAAYAEELTLRQMAKDIKGWDRQVPLDLKVNGVHITNYYIDFVIQHNDGSQEFVECKGFEMEVWKLKWRILEATFDQFKEHPDDKLIVIKQSSSWRRRSQ
jgi:hypothetical protein